MTNPMSPMVPLPRMNAAETIAMILALKTALEAGLAAQAQSSEERAANRRGRRGVEAERAPVVPVSIPSCVSACSKRLDAAGEGLTRARREVAKRSEGRASRAERRVLFNNYKKASTTLRAQLSVWRATGAVAKLDARQRQALDQALPPDGNARVRSGSAPSVWIDGMALRERMKADGVDRVIASLGGAQVFAHFEEAHDDLGVSLGVTAESPADTSTSGAVADALTTARAVMREYVVKVSAMVDPEAPGADALAADLLAPLTRARAASRVRAAKVGKAAKPVGPIAPVAPMAASPVMRPTGTG